MVSKPLALSGKSFLIFLMVLTLGTGSYGARLQVSPQAGVTLDGWKAEITTFSLSPRIVSLMIVPEEVKAVTLTVRAGGLDAGDYDLAVSGSPVKRYSAEDLAKGVEVLIPEVMGVIAGPAKVWADEWVGRLDRAEAKVADLGYTPQETPASIQQQVNLLRGLPPVLEDAAQAKSARLCIARSESGPVALPALSSHSLAEINQKVEAAHAASIQLIHLVNNLDEAAVKRAIFSEILGDWIVKPKGKEIEMALAGQPGIAEFILPIQNSFANPAVSLNLTLKPPTGWEPNSDRESSFDLEPGQSKDLSFSFSIPPATPGQRIAIPVDLKIKIAGETILQKTGVGFGNEFLKSWKIVGPFPIVSHTNVEVGFAPEKDTLFSSRYDTPTGSVTWKEVQAERNGLVDLGKAFADETNCVAYATLWVYLPSSQTLEASVGSDDSIKVWANEKAVFSRSASRAAAPNQDVFLLPLKMGWNRLLVKITQGSNQWGFFFDLRERTGVTPRGMRFALEPPKR